MCRYDRILVMDGGTVAEYDSPLDLFDNGGIFRGMCDRSSIARDQVYEQCKGLRVQDG